MSGLEVLGAITGVLGILPMAVDTAQWYKTTLSSIRYAARDLKRLIEELETEKVRLQTTCEVLLDGISPLAMIDGMAKDSFLAFWKKHNHLLNLRLGGSEQKIKDHILGMRKAANELEAKLWIYGGGSSKPADKRSIIRELKKNMSFTLKKRDYNDILSKIKVGNSALEELARNNRKLEPSRRKQSQTRLIHFVRGLSKDVFQAIQTSTTCECIASHRVCLELVKREAVLTSEDKNDDVARDWNFHVAFGFGDNAETNSTDHQSMSANEQLINRWSNIYLRLGTFGIIQTTAIKPEPLPAPEDPEPTKKTLLQRFKLRRRRDKNRRPSTIISAMEGARSCAMATMPIMAASSKPVSNLCHMLSTYTERPDTYCLGYVASHDRKFGIHLPNSRMDRYTVSTLREVLEGKRQLSYPEKLKIAHAIAVNTLHLYKTPWVDECLTLDSVVFFLPNDDGDVDTTLLDRPFVVKNFPTPPSQQSRTPRRIDGAVFSVGALLIQLMIGKAENALEMTGPMNFGTIITKRDEGRQLFDRLLESSGFNLKPAIEWCFNSMYHRMGGLQDEQYCQRFFEEVVSRLEEEIKYFSGN
ncbi:uncharacterized protein Triagg1_2609 [Trichoderma aggressivum f. europaeum]|uniref:Uncharacterized protein n=1 Tax=Trichoderma aggressivum f. europaeum TaxID=173218 RepID=A0AAE1M7K8_9HYPO|nr:hypothetical protein Triagg1_2609 [Trichoderma aggressivum f. europaeum]